MSEKQTLRTIQAVYKKALQDVENKLVISNGKINTLLKDVDNLSDEEKSILQSQIYQRKFQRSLKSQLNIMLKDLEINQYRTVNDYLKASYHNGYIGSLYNINMQGMPIIMPIDPYLVHRAIEIDSKIKHGLYKNLVDKVDVFKRRIANDISRGIASSTSYHDMAAWIRHDTKVSVGKSMRIVRTEGNRVYNAATLDCGKGAKERGCDLVKVWDSTLDMKTRPTHRECDGQVRELNKDFKNANGEAKAPGQFGIASEDINCRCAVLIKPRWDVDGSFTKRDNQTGELKEFEGVKSYKEFKKRYWESVDKSGKSGIIGVEKQRGITDMNSIQETHTAAGNRRSPFYQLTNEEIEYVKSEIKAINGNIDDFIFNSNMVRGTCFLASDGKVHIKGNIFPDESSSHPRDIMSVRAVLAHEYYGHRPYRQQYIKEDNDTSPEAINKIMSRAWADEFRASYMAAKNAPNLSSEDRYLLVRDSLSRAEEAGVSIKYNDFIRRVLYG